MTWLVTVSPSATSYCGQADSHQEQLQVIPLLETCIGFLVTSGKVKLLNTPYRTKFPSFWPLGTFILFLTKPPSVILNFFYIHERSVPYFPSLQICCFFHLNTLTLQISHHPPLLKHTPMSSFGLANSYSRSLTDWELHQGIFCWGLDLFVRLVPPNLCCYSILCSYEKPWHTLLVIKGLASLFSQTHMSFEGRDRIQSSSPLNTQWMNGGEMTHKVNGF